MQDLVSTIPWQFFVSGSQTKQGLFRLIPLIRLIRILRLKQADSQTIGFNEWYWRMIRLLAYLALMSWYLGNCWWGLSEYEGFDSSDTPTGGFVAWHGLLDLPLSSRVYLCFDSFK